MRPQCGLTVRDLSHVRMVDKSPLHPTGCCAESHCRRNPSSAAARRSTMLALQHQAEDARKVAPRMGADGCGIEQ
jgi:hypothetical protein